MTLRTTLRRHRRRLIRKARRALRRRMRTTLRTLAAHARPTPTRTARRTQAKPAPAARTARPSTGAGPRAASMKQRVKRGKGGKFNGSAADHRKAVTAAAKKLAAKQVAAEARQAEKFRRALAAGDQRVARVSKRVQSADARLDRDFGHTPAQNTERSDEVPARLVGELFQAKQLLDELKRTGANRNREQIARIEAYTARLEGQYLTARNAKRLRELTSPTDD